MPGATGYDGIFVSNDAAGNGALPDGYLYGLLPFRQTTAQIGINPGLCRSDDNTQDIVQPGTNVADVTATGANGRNIDSAEAASTWYEVNTILNPTSGAVASFLINENDVGAFTYPAGYTVKRRVGWWFNGSSSNFNKMFYTGTGIHKRAQYDLSDGSSSALIGGNSVAWASVGLTPFVPPTSNLCDINCIFHTALPNTTARVRLPSPIPLTPVQIHSDDDTSIVFSNIMTDSTQKIEYMVSNAAEELDIYMIGFVDDL